jgi:uncharacterized protein (TIGR01777 family)
MRSNDTTGAVVVVGANGFLGRYLCRHFARRGREVVAVARRRAGWSGDGMFLPWDGTAKGPWALALDGAEAVINLAGRSVNCRYNARNRREILNSRVATTRAIGEAIARCRMPPRVWLNASTATIYQHAGERPMDEWRGEYGDGFSVSVARAWEDAFFGARVPGRTRKLALRAGMVLAHEPGTVFERLAQLAAVGLGGTMSDGSQRVSWIHMADFLTVIDWLIERRELDGVINVTAPGVVDNRELMEVFRGLSGLSFGLPLARWMLELGAWWLGTEAELVLKSRWVTPQRLLDSGFRFAWPELAGAAENLAGRQGLEGFFGTAVQETMERRGVPVAGGA